MTTPYPVLRQLLGPRPSDRTPMSPSFDSTAWVPEQHVYGLLPLLMCREVIREELTLPPPDDRLKVKLWKGANPCVFYRHDCAQESSTDAPMQLEVAKRIVLAA
eukprot:s1435_g6.t1